MGYELYAFVAQRGKFAQLKELSPYITVAEVQQGFDLLLSDWHLAEALKLSYFEKTQGFEETSLDKSLITFAEQLSKDSQIGYIEAKFFGGAGHQYAFLWENSKLLLSPATNGWQGFRPMHERPINEVLKAMGVEAERYDEFAALGLMQYRHMEDWFEAFTEFSRKDYYPE
jgi:hypothetical protein